MTWNPDAYHQFRAERLRPAIDLLSRIDLDAPGLIADLGCGSGEATGLLRQRWPAAAIIGVDSSPAMLAAAPSLDGVEWVEADMTAWRPSRPLDLIFSNAALHWARQHDVLFPTLIGMLAPGGVLAVQAPNNFHAPSHKLIRQAGADWFDGALAFLAAPVPVHALHAYYDWLAPLCSRVDLWRTDYIHCLWGEDPVFRWTSATTLRPVRAALSPSDWSLFEERYKDALREAYPRRTDGTTLFTFTRLFVIAQR